MKKLRLVMMLVVAVVLLLLVACSSNSNQTGNTSDVKPQQENKADNNQAASEQQEAPPPLSDEPITLKVFQAYANITDDDFNQFFVEPVKAKYPNITLEIVRRGDGVTERELVASGEMPDLIYTSNKFIFDFEDLDIPVDLAPLAKKYNVDLSRINDQPMNFLYDAYPDKLVALPFIQNWSALFYNKDIFDRYNVNYPVDGMTWDEVINLANEFEKAPEEDGIIGLAPSYFDHIVSPKLDAWVEVSDSGFKSAINTDGVREAIELYVRLGNIVGVELTGDGNHPGNMINQYYANQGAMITQFGIGAFSRLTQLENNNASFNWDMVTYPVYADTPGISLEFDAHVLMISSTSKHQDAAFRVLELVTSDESQTYLSRNGKYPAVKNPDVQAQFAADVFAGKNIDAAFKTTPAVVGVTPHDNIVKNILLGKYQYIFGDGTDANTHLKNWQEEADQQLQAAFEGQ